MLYNTVPLAEELSINNTAIIAKISTPIMLFFIDTSFILENYVTQLKFIEMIAKDYVGKYVFIDCGEKKCNHAVEVSDAELIAIWVFAAIQQLLCSK